MVKAELEREHTAQVLQIRGEAEQRTLEVATQAAARVRGELEQTLASERAQAEARLEAERAQLQIQAEAEREKAVARAQVEREQALARTEDEKRRLAEELEHARSTFDAMRAADRAAHDAARAALEAQLSSRAAAPVAAPVAAASTGLGSVLREIDATETLSSALTAIARAAASQAPRAALFVASGEQLREWEVPNTAPISPAPLYVRDTAIGVIGEAVRAGTLARSDNGGAPAVAGPRAKRSAAVPLILDGHAVGVIYGDSDQSNAGGDWAGALDAIAAHGAARLGYITAIRTAQAMRWITAQAVAPATLATAPSSEQEEQAALRFARLLVSEIKLYNEEAVRLGREHRDLKRRLAEDLARSRQLYVARVPASVSLRDVIWENELVHTLAGGDPSLLG